ncbi:MAG: hypothetical protein COA80_10145 [Leeuwenhoekiella sp.]|nr:MAG: hypothetical protein COA80_10145 [Leeuwenhoekiella sp.]
MYAGYSLFLIGSPFGVFCFLLVCGLPFTVMTKSGIRNQKPEIRNQKKNPLKENKKPTLYWNAGFDQKWFYPLI